VFVVDGLFKDFFFADVFFIDFAMSSLPKNQQKREKMYFVIKLNQTMFNG
jgi:hypothetical protein